MAFADGTGWSLSELARITNIPLTTTTGSSPSSSPPSCWSARPTGYRVGPALDRLRATGSAGGPTLTRLAPAVLDDLAAVTGRPVRLGVLRELRVTYVEKAGRAPTTSFAAGAQLPLHASALGKVLLAFAPSSVTRSLVATGLPRFTPRTLTRADQLLHALSVTRLTRIATCDGELVAGETHGGGAGRRPGRPGRRGAGDRGARPGRGGRRAPAPHRQRAQPVPRAGGCGCRPTSRPDRR